MGKRRQPPKSNIKQNPSQKRGIRWSDVFYGYCGVALLLFGATLTLGMVKELTDAPEFAEELYNRTANTFSWWILPVYLLCFKLPKGLLDLYRYLEDIVNRVIEYVWKWLLDLLVKVINDVIFISKQIYHSYAFQKLLEWMISCKDGIVLVYDALVVIAKDIWRRLDEICTIIWDKTFWMREMVSYLVDSVIELVFHLINIVMEYIFMVVDLSVSLLSRVMNQIFDLFQNLLLQGSYVMNKILP